MMNAAPETWDIAWLEKALSGDDLLRAEVAVERWVREDPANRAYGEAAKSCFNWRRYDLAGAIRLGAFRAGVDPYEAAYAMDVLWRASGNAAESADLAESLGGELRSIRFDFQGDEFHIGMVEQALNDLARLARYDEGQLGLDAAMEPPMHPIALDAIWRRIWPAHNALQFRRAQRLALLYAKSAAIDAEMVFYIVETFFVDYGGVTEARQLLDELVLDESQELRRQALYLVMAYETGDAIRFSAAAEFLRLHEHVENVPDVAQRALATSLLYRARERFSQGDGNRAIEMCQLGLSMFPESSWRGVFNIAVGAMVEATDLPLAMIQYEVGLESDNFPRSPFGLYSVADACAAAGRWDLVHKIFERYADRLRPHYRALSPSHIAYDTLRPDTLPKSALFLSGWSVGDDTFRYGLLRAHLRDGDFTVMLDGRLIDMARRAQPNWNFLAHTRVHEVGWDGFWRERAGTPDAVDPLRCPRVAWSAAQNHGAVILQEDMLAIHAARQMKSPTPNSTAALEPREERVRYFLQWLNDVCDGRPSIGLSWRSGLYTTSRAFSFFSSEEMGRLMASAPAAWVLLQYDWVQSEIEHIQSVSGKTLLIHPELDIRNDLEGVAAMARACDMVMSTGVATREICAAAGANVYSISFGWPYADAWRRDPEDRDTIFPTMTHAKPGGGREAVLEQAMQTARSLCGNR